MGTLPSIPLFPSNPSLTPPHLLTSPHFTSNPVHPPPSTHPVCAHPRWFAASERESQGSKASESKCAVFLTSIHYICQAAHFSGVVYLLLVTLGHPMRSISRFGRVFDRYTCAKSICYAHVWLEYLENHGCSALFYPSGHIYMCWYDMVVLKHALAPDGVRTGQKRPKTPF